MPRATTKSSSFYSLCEHHLPPTMRGVQKPGSYTRTSVVPGICREKVEARAEALELFRAA